MADKFISIKRLAQQLGMDRSHARRYVLGLGFHPKKRRTVDSANQLSLTLTAAEPEAVIARRTEAGFLDSGKPVINEHGVFYIVQLVPDLDPRRLKLGFAINMNERLSQHRTAAPTATPVRVWPCRRSWESTAIDCMTRVGCRLISNEVYEVDDVAAIMRRGDEFFSLMPPVELRPDLATASPFSPRKAD